MHGFAKDWHMHINRYQSASFGNHFLIQFIESYSASRVIFLSNLPSKRTVALCWQMQLELLLLVRLVFLVLLLMYAISASHFVADCRCLHHEVAQFRLVLICASGSGSQSRRGIIILPLYLPRLARHPNVTFRRIPH